MFLKIYGYGTGIGAIGFLLIHFTYALFIGNYVHTINLNSINEFYIEFVLLIIGFIALILTFKNHMMKKRR